MTGGGWTRPNARFRAEEEKVTLVVRVSKEDIRWIRMAIALKEYQMPAIERFLDEVNKQLPKED